MDVPAAAAGPWITLGAVLGILLLLAAGAVALRLRSGAAGAPPPAPPPAEPPRDDLADFLARPPGTPGAPDPATGDGWVPLASAALPAPHAEPLPAAPSGAPGAGTVIAGLAVAALLLIGTAAALAAAAGSPGAAPDRSRAAAPPPSGSPSGSPSSSAATGITARLAFEGVVLEEHAVGITAAHPELELSVSGDDAVAHLRLPAVNCLAAAAPPAAGDPACRAARAEYADLASPRLRVERAGDEITVQGRFETYRRPPGGAPEATGRVHEVSVTVVAPDDDATGWVPAEAGLEWDGRTTATRAGGAENVVRPGG